MSTIGLNEGPFLIMTITYDNSVFTIADTVENKVPTIQLSSADTIYLAENFSKLRQMLKLNVDSDVYVSENSFVNAPPIWGITSEIDNVNLISTATQRLAKDIEQAIETSFNNSIGTAIPEEPVEEVILLDSLVLKARVWGCEYLITIRKVLDVERGRGVVSMEIHNGGFDVKGYFTKDAEEFFQWVLDDITHPNAHEHLD